MTTPLLGIPEVSDGQINQYLVYNEALRLLEGASNQLLSVNLASGNYTIPDADFLKNFYFASTGNTVARSVTVPALKRFFSVYNGGSADLSVVRGTSSQSLAAGVGATFYTDGTANGLVKFGGGGGSIAWFLTSKNSASPNTSTPVVVLSADDTATDVDACVLAKGTGAFLLNVPDGTSAGGNKRGSGSVDLQMLRVAASQVASGNSSFAAGSGSTASGFNSTAINGTASGPQSYAFGGTASAQQSFSFGIGNASSGVKSYCIGVDCKSLAESSIALGLQSSTKTRFGSMALASGMFSDHGDAQAPIMVLRKLTTNATPAALTSDPGGASFYNQMILSDNSAMAFRGKVVARQNTTGDVAAWEFFGVIKRGANAAATAIVGSVTTSLLAADTGAATWAFAVSADTSNGSLSCTVTGEAAKNIRWVCSVECCEVAGT